jgi:hypothetical protein
LSGTASGTLAVVLGTTVGRVGESPQAGTSNVNSSTNDRYRRNISNLFLVRER